jgi:hypothetical protein
MGGVVDMSKYILLSVGFTLCFSSLAFGQASDTPFQIRALTNLKPKDAIVVTNSNASNAATGICADVYALAADDGHLLDCCGCVVPPNGLRSIPITADILENPKPKPKVVVLKLMASSGVAGVCNAGTVDTGGDNLVTGMLVWKGDVPFSPATLSAGELSKLNTQCSALHASPVTCAACLPPAM